MGGILRSGRMLRNGRVCLGGYGSEMSCIWEDMGGIVDNGRMDDKRGWNRRHSRAHDQETQKQFKTTDLAFVLHFNFFFRFPRLLIRFQ